MKVGRVLMLSACLLAASLSGTALATTVHTAAGFTNMRSGPGTEYAIVAKLRGGSRISIEACLPDYSWCRGRTQGARGWVPATRLADLHAQRPGMKPPIITYGDASRVSGRILGEVTDRPGYCYALDENSDSVVVPCDGGSGGDPAGDGAGRILGKVTDRPGYCYALDARGNSVVVPCP